MVVSTEELRALVREAVADQMAEFLEDARQPAQLLDRRGIAAALGVSCPSIDRLTREGMPSLRLGDATPRFVIADVLTWLKSR